MPEFFKGLLVVFTKTYSLGFGGIQAGTVIVIRSVDPKFITFNLVRDRKGVYDHGSYRLPSNKLHAITKRLDHMANCTCLEDHCNQFVRGEKVEAVVDSYRDDGKGRYFKKGDVFTVERSATNGKFKVEGRALFSANKFKIHKGQQMKNIPSTKFFMVAEENANSSRKTFVAVDSTPEAKEVARAAAKAHADSLIRGGSTGVVIMEAMTVIRPKVNVDEIDL